LVPQKITRHLAAETYTMRFANGRHSSVNVIRRFGQQLREKKCNHDKYCWASCMYIKTMLKRKCKTTQQQYQLYVDELENNMFSTNNKNM
jgi:hypothetical protein